MPAAARPAEAGRMTHTHRIRAACLVIGPLLFTVGDLLRRLVEPSGAPSAASITEAVGQHRPAWFAAAALSVAAAFCFVPAMAGVLDAVRGRSRVATVGALLVGVGAMASVGHAVAFYSPYALFAEAHTPAGQIAAIDNASESSPLLLILIGLFMVGMIVGPVVLLVGLRRARLVPLWSVVAAIVFVVCGGTGGILAGLVGVVAALAAFGPAARMMLASPGTPEHAEADHVGVPSSAA